MSVSLSEFQPDPVLSSFVEFYWEGAFNTTLEPLLKQYVIPNGFVELIIHLSDSHCDLISGQTWNQSPDYTIIGLHTRPYEVQFRNCVNVFGIRFKPDGIYNLFGIPASFFSERYEDMELVLGNDFHDFCSSLREAKDIQKRLMLSQKYLCNQLEKHHSGLTYVNRAAEIIRRKNCSARIEELPDKVFISLRQLEREFKNKIGVTPKQYMRIARLNALNRYFQTNKDYNLADLSYETGFSDQAHLIREFKSFAGTPPTKFLKSIHHYIVNV
jgi:AraC-like DNA-binding protein